MTPAGADKLVQLGKPDGGSTRAADGPLSPAAAPAPALESFHVTWAGAIADALNETLLPEGYFAEEHASIKSETEADVIEPAIVIAPDSTDVRDESASSAAFTDQFEVRVYEAEGGARLVAALELVSLANKDRDARRRAFATKCAGYLAQGIAMIVVDVVTSRSGNLHADILRLLGRAADTGLPEGTDLYAVAYRPVVREQAELVEAWPQALTVGSELPTLPLALNAELCLPIDLEATYTAACQRGRWVR